MFTLTIPYSIRFFIRAIMHPYFNNIFEFFSHASA